MTRSESIIRRELASAVEGAKNAKSPSEARALEAEIVRWWGELRAREPRADWSPA